MINHWRACDVIMRVAHAHRRERDFDTPQAMKEDSEGPFEEAEFHIRSHNKRPRCFDPTKEYKSPAGFELKDPCEDYVRSCSSGYPAQSEEV